MGVTVEEYDDSIRVVRSGELNEMQQSLTLGFPTDMQPQITTLLSIASGTSIVE